MKNYWPLEESERYRIEYEDMNSCKRFFKLMSIPDKHLFVMSGDIDTYVFLLFLRNVIYLLIVLCIINCPLLLGLYATGETVDECKNEYN